MVEILVSVIVFSLLITLPIWFFTKPRSSTTVVSSSSTKNQSWIARERRLLIMLVQDLISLPQALSVEIENLDNDNCKGICRLYQLLQIIVWTISWLSYAVFHKFLTVPTKQSPWNLKEAVGIIFKHESETVRDRSVKQANFPRPGWHVILTVIFKILALIWILGFTNILSGDWVSNWMFVGWIFGISSQIVEYESQLFSQLAGWALRIDGLKSMNAMAYIHSIASDYKLTFLGAIIGMLFSLWTSYFTWNCFTTNPPKDVELVAKSRLHWQNIFVHLGEFVNPINKFVIPKPKIVRLKIKNRAINFLGSIIFTLIRMIYYLVYELLPGLIGYEQIQIKWIPGIITNTLGITFHIVFKIIPAYGYLLIPGMMIFVYWYESTLFWEMVPVWNALWGTWIIFVIGVGFTIWMNETISLTTDAVILKGNPRLTIWGIETVPYDYALRNIALVTETMRDGFPPGVAIRFNPAMKSYLRNEDRSPEGDVEFRMVPKKFYNMVIELTTDAAIAAMIKGRKEKKKD